jgi:chorismate synthase
VGRLRILTAGESHGAKLVAIIEGLPAGLKVDPARVDRELKRRQEGYGRGYRMRSIERDTAVFSAGMRFGETIGAPLAVEVANADHANWVGVMDALPGADPSLAEAKALHRPRPGHADLAGALKYGRSDLRDVLERASARNTAVRVAAGAVSKMLLEEVEIRILSLVTKIGGVELDPAILGELPDWAALAARAEASDVRCPDEPTALRMRARIDEARKAGDTVGGAFLVVATGVPTGLGSYAEWDRRLDGRLAQAVMAVPAVKAVEFGIGVQAGDVLGSEAHDAIAHQAARAADGSGGYLRRTNRAGGLEGGITNGAAVVIRATMKPISTLARPLESVDVRTKQASLAGYERSDVCAVPACAVIAEAAVAFCLADAALEAYGADTVGDFKAAHRARVERFARA